MKKIINNLFYYYNGDVNWYSIFFFSLMFFILIFDLWVILS